MLNVGKWLLMATLLMGVNAAHADINIKGLYASMNVVAVDARLDNGTWIKRKAVGGLAVDQIPLDGYTNRFTYRMTIDQSFNPGMLYSALNTKPTNSSTTRLVTSNTKSTGGLTCQKTFGLFDHGTTCSLDLGSVSVDARKDQFPD